MTTIITRLYTDAAAEAAVAALGAGGIDGDMVSLIPAGEGAAAAMKAARVSPAAAAAYGRAMAPGHALVVVEVGFNPVGAARKAMRILAKHPGVDVGLVTEDEYIEEIADFYNKGSVIEGGRLYMSNPFVRPSHGHILGSRPVKNSPTKTSAIRGGAYMSKSFWPMKLVTSKATNSAISGGFLFSSMFGLPLLTKSWAPREQVPTKI
jgi:hypothetical protein